MDGIVVIDKEKGVTSQRIVTEVKRVLNVGRAGHTGTLDPFATGVLPVCLGEARKVIPFLDDNTKEYEAVLMLGIETDTMDATGRVVYENKVNNLALSDIVDIFSKYRGEIKQIPPMFSSLKKDGVRLYDLARKGITVPRPARTVLIEKIRLLDYSHPFIRFFVRCSRGTYVRVLGSDIAKEFGYGGHLTELRRLRSGIFRLEDSLLMENLKSGNFRLIYMAEALSNINEIHVTEKVAVKIREGKQIRKSDLSWTDMSEFEVGDKLKICENRRVVSVAQALVGSNELYKLDDQGIVFKLLRVFN
jgi:tRNA pseudouridine55 synthase